MNRFVIHHRLESHHVGKWRQVTHSAYVLWFRDEVETAVRRHPPTGPYLMQSELDDGITRRNLTAPFAQLMSMIQSRIREIALQQYTGYRKLSSLYEQTATWKIEVKSQHVFEKSPEAVSVRLKKKHATRKWRWWMEYETIILAPELSHQTKKNFAQFCTLFPTSVRFLAAESNVIRQRPCYKTLHHGHCDAFCILFPIFSRNYWLWIVGMSNAGEGPSKHTSIQRDIA